MVPFEAKILLIVAEGIEFTFPAGNPVKPDVAFTVQLKIAPVTSDVRFNAELAVPEQITWLVRSFVICATGWTLTS